MRLFVCLNVHMWVISKTMSQTLAILVIQLVRSVYLMPLIAYLVSLAFSIATTSVLQVVEQLSS